MSALKEKDVIILGAGGHAKVIADVLVQDGCNILGFLTPDLESGTVLSGYPVLGDDDVVKQFTSDTVTLANGIGALPKQDLRWRLAQQMRDLRFSFATVIHPSAVIADDVELAEGVQVMAGCVIQPGVRIGADCIINSGAVVDHDCVISKNSHIAPGVVCSGSVTVGDGSHLGTGAVVTQNISIGRNCVIAAGSVVYNDVADKTIVIQRRELIQ